MRFAFVIPNLSGGGAEKAILKIAGGLAERGHEVALFVFEERAEYALPEKLTVHFASPGRSAVSKGWLGKRFLAWKLKGFVRNFKPDLTVSTLPFADEVAYLAGLPGHWCRIANTLSAEIDKLAQQSASKATRRLARYRTVYGTGHLIAVSQGVAADLRRAISASAEVRVLPNPFDADAIRVAADQPCAGLPSRPFVLHVGRFSAQKRHDFLLDAWQAMPDGWQLVLLTNPDPRLSGMIAERGLQARVQVAGFQQNPYPWMKAAALTVLCSDHEGLPNVLIESLLCGTPVVSTDCPSGPSEILQAGMPEALVPCGDVLALRQAISAFLAAPPDISRIDLSRYAFPQAIAAYEALAASSRGLA